MKAIGIVAALTCITLLPVQAIADEDGEKLYKQHCKKCHSLEPGKHQLGPSLAGIFGQQAGKQDFDKYKALVDSDIVWDEENMDAWIADPKKFIGQRTTMVVKVKKSEQRAAIIEYIKEH